MKALLVRVGADLSEGGGYFNGLVDSRTNKFVYVPIPESGALRAGLNTPYSLLAPALKPFIAKLPHRLEALNMHLDPDFEHLTYGDQGKRALQIQALERGDLIVFYAGLRDINPNPRLVYAIIGLYVIDTITPATAAPASSWHENAHTRRDLPSTALDIIVRAKPGVSGRLEKCLQVGSYRTPVGEPAKRPCYRVDSAVLSKWGGLDNKDGYLQRSGYLPSYLDASGFYDWFLAQKPTFKTANN